MVSKAAADPLAPLRELLDERVVGHDDAKQALLLALTCREHVYLEGPPGTAKTLMAEVAARGSNLGFFFYQFHRDTRLAELVGDVVLERRPLEGEAGERIHQRVEPGGILEAAVAVLDDISRAPGEALNVLLRILNERRFGEREIPLLTAIATSNPFQDEYYNEPLDPANLDRFALQLRVEGLLQGGDAGVESALPLPDVSRQTLGYLKCRQRCAVICVVVSRTIQQRFAERKMRLHIPWLYPHRLLASTHLPVPQPLPLQFQ